MPRPALALVFLLGLCLLCPVSAPAEQVDIGILTVKSRELAQKLRQRLEQGEAFESLAREHSVAPTASRGGRLGRVALGRLRPEFRQAIRGLAPGQPSQVVPTEEGFNILMRFGAGAAARAEPAPEPREEVRRAPRQRPAAPQPEQEEHYLEARQKILAGLEAMSAGDLVEAESRFSEAMGLSPREETAPFLLEMARAARRDKVQPDAAQSFARGFMAMTRGEGDEALKGFRQAMRQDPDLWQAKLFTANLLAGQGQKEQAKALWREVLVDNPQAALAYASLGMVARDEGDLDEARRLLQKALQLNPDLAEAHYILGGIALHRGDFPEAARRFKTTVALAPYKEEAYNDLGLALAYQGQAEEAEKAYLRALELNPQNALAHLNLGTLYAQQRRLEKAVDEFLKALNQDPGLADAHSNLAAAYILQDKWDLAIKHADAALDMNYPVPEPILKKLEPHRRQEKPAAQQ
jgi:tetratricopeptide (TPR) repeat protein